MGSGGASSWAFFHDSRAIRAAHSAFPSIRQPKWNNKWQLSCSLIPFWIVVGAAAIFVMMYLPSGAIWLTPPIRWASPSRHSCEHENHQPASRQREGPPQTSSTGSCDMWHLVQLGAGWLSPQRVSWRCWTGGLESSLHLGTDPP